MSQHSKREFLIGKDCNYSDTLLESNVPDIIAGAPGRLNPKYKDQFETTAQFDARVQQHKNELKNYNANMLKTIKVQNVPIYKLTDTKYSMFSYNADYKLLTIACRFNWCLGCSHRWIWGVMSTTTGYNVAQYTFADKFSRSDFTRSGYREKYFKVSFEVEPQIAKEIISYTESNEKSPYSITLQITPRVYEENRWGMIPIFNIDNYWLVKDGQIITKFNPRNLPTTKTT